MEVLQEEDNHVQDRIGHEQNALQEHLIQLEHGLENHNAMVEEIKKLQEELSAKEEERSNESVAHAERVHNLKRDMVELRQQLEQTFRKALMETDRMKQQHAFESLSDASKSAMLANAKLNEAAIAKAGGTARVRAWIWEEPNAVPDGAASCDIVLAADLLYQRDGRQLQPLCEVLRRLLEPALLESRVAGDLALVGGRRHECPWELHRATWEDPDVETAPFF